MYVERKGPGRRLKLYQLGTFTLHCEREGSDQIERVDVYAKDYILCVDLPPSIN